MLSVNGFDLIIGDIIVRNVCGFCVFVSGILVGLLGGYGTWLATSGAVGQEFYTFRLVAAIALGVFGFFWYVSVCLPQLFACCLN